MHKIGAGSIDDRPIRITTQDLDSLVYAFGISFLALLLLSTPHLTEHNGWWRPVNLSWFVLWIAGACYYFNMGTDYDGLVERVLGFAYLAWMFLLAWRLAIEGGSHLGKQTAARE